MSNWFTDEQVNYDPVTGVIDLNLKMAKDVYDGVTMEGLVQDVGLALLAAISRHLAVPDTPDIAAVDLNAK